MEQELILLLIACILIYIYTQQTEKQKKIEHFLTGNCSYPLLSNGVCWKTWDQLFKK